MKYIILILAIFSCSTLHAQDGFYLTKEQHEQIKKNLRDYKTLIYNFDEQKKKFEELSRQFALTKKLHAEREAELTRIKHDNINIHNLEIKIQNLETEKLELNEKIASMQRELDTKNKSLITYKTKYQKEYTANRGDRIIVNSIWASFAVAAVWGIYISIEQNYVR